MHTLYDMYDLCISWFKKPIKLLVTISMILCTETKEEKSLPCRSSQYRLLPGHSVGMLCLVTMRLQTETIIEIFNA